MADRLQELKAQALLETPYDASDPAMVAEAQKKAEDERDYERRSIFELMETQQGRKFMWGSVSCAFFGDPVVPGDSLSTYYNLGMESRARHLMRELLKISSHRFSLMVKENAGEEYSGKDMAERPEAIHADRFI